jgi:hypothetical protein
MNSKGMGEFDMTQDLNLQAEFKIIDAQHKVESDLRSELELVRMLLDSTEYAGLLPEEGGSFLTRLQIQKLVQRHPEFASRYNIFIAKRL